MSTNNTAEHNDALDLFSDEQLDFLGCMMRIYNIIEKKGLPEDELNEILVTLYEMFARFDLEYYDADQMEDQLERMMRPAAFEALCENIENDSENMVNEDLFVIGCDVDDCDDDDDECADDDYEDDDSDGNAPRGHLA